MFNVKKLNNLNVHFLRSEASTASKLVIAADDVQKLSLSISKAVHNKQQLSSHNGKAVNVYITSIVYVIYSSRLTDETAVFCL